MIFRSLILLTFSLLGLVSCGEGLCGSNGEGCFVDNPSVGSASSVDDGSGTGSVTVTITGTGFVNGMTVTVNGNNCTNVNILSSTTATCTLPNGQIALINIIVTAPSGGSGGSSITSPLISSTAASAVDGGGSQLWSNLSSAKANAGDQASAIRLISPGEDTNFIILTGYFSLAAQTLPATATVTGVIANCNWQGRSTPSEPNYLNSVKLILNGSTLSSERKPVGGEALPGSLATSSSWGGSSDTWGLTLTPSDVNHSTFGIRIKVSGAGVLMGFSGIGSIDYCTLSVYFTQ